MAPWLKRPREVQNRVEGVLMERSMLLSLDHPGIAPGQAKGRGRGCPVVVSWVTGAKGDQKEAQFRGVPHHPNRCGHELHELERA